MLGILLAMADSEEERELITELYNKYEQIMYRAAYGILNNKHDSEDAVSEAFIRIINNLHKISDVDSKKTRGYFVIIVKNVALDILRTTKRTCSYDEIEGTMLTRDDFAEFNNSGAQNIKDALQSLSPEQKHTITLRFVMGLTTEETAAALGISPSAVYRRLITTKKQLRKMLKEE